MKMDVLFQQKLKLQSLHEMTISETHSNYNSFGVSAFGATDGFIDITVDGGTGNYTYVWSNGETTEDLEDLV